MNSLNIGDCVGAAWAQYRRNMLTHLVATVLVLAIGNLFFGLLAGPMFVGYLRLMQSEDAGRTVSFTEVFRGFDDFGPSLLTALLAFIVVFIGLCLCVLPGLLLMPLLPLSLYEVAQGEKDAVRALQNAWARLRPQLFMAFLCSLVLWFIGSIGALLCGVGVLLTLPLAYLGAYHMARQLAGPSPVVFTQ